MSDRDMKLLPYQQALVDSTARFTWNCWARQTGKSTALSLRRLRRALVRKRDQIIVSAGERQSREVMHKVHRHIEALLEGTGLSKEHRDALEGAKLRRDVAVLGGGARIIALPANPLTARGYTGDLFLDEFAMHHDGKAIWSALFPSLLRGEGELDVASTPRGRRNMFHKLKGNDLFTHSTVTLADAVAAGLPVDLDEMRRGIDDEWAWRQEFCCEFLDEATAFMTLELIERCQDRSLRTAVDWERLGRRELEIYVGVDIGRWRDATVVWLWERRRQMSDVGVRMADGSMIEQPTSSRNTGTSKDPNVESGASGRGGDIGEHSTSHIRPPTSNDEEFVTRGVVVLTAAPFVEQEALIRRLLDMPAVRRCCLDKSGLGMQMAEQLASQYGEHRVEGVTFTAAFKSELAGLLRVLAERGALRIPADEAIVTDWHSISRLTTAGGHVRYDADRSEGGHGDRFWAAALGLHAARGMGPSGPPGLVTAGRMRFARVGVW